MGDEEFRFWIMTKVVTKNAEGTRGIPKVTSHLGGGFGIDIVGAESFVLPLF
jgi:hypothetical protein